MLPPIKGDRKQGESCHVDGASGTLFKEPDSQRIRDEPQQLDQAARLITRDSFDVQHPRAYGAA
ncbi:hypothetical protein [Streptosporangium sp. NPDC087985]|uniref:hypothetical protein n=1 Tax=Streptosporangium sp. NPDC087985 TaxID=3366196 RepID=UPI00381AFF8A